MIDRLRDFLARRVYHPLQGMTFGDWWHLLRQHHFAVDPLHWPRALVQTAASVNNSVIAGAERLRHGGRIDAAIVQPPLFILGHYRSGTTHLFNLLSLDPQFAAPSFFQALNPHTFLITERSVAPIVDGLMVRRRYQDAMALSAAVPSEDEFALCTMTCLSPYMGWTFPRDGARYERYLTLNDVTDEERTRWANALTLFLKKLTLKYDRRLLLKSPPHTARIRLLLALFPDAQFVHIHRNPYDVFASTRHTIRALQPLYRFQECPPPDGDDQILAGYNAMHDAFFAERALIPDGRFCDVGYEDLVRAPVDVVGSIYKSLGLENFDAIKRRLESYLSSISDYRTNRLEELPDALRHRIAQEWCRSFDAWGYAR
jgi:hypothetical protein